MPTWFLLNFFHFKNECFRYFMIIIFQIVLKILLLISWFCRKAVKSTVKTTMATHLSVWLSWTDTTGEWENFNPMKSISDDGNFADNLNAFYNFFFFFLMPLQISLSLFLRLHKSWLVQITAWRKQASHCLAVWWWPISLMHCIIGPQSITLLTIEPVKYVVKSSKILALPW